MQETMLPPFHRRKNLELLLIVASIALLALPVRSWSGYLPLNIGLVQGSVVTAQRLSARNLVLDISSGNVTLRSGNGTEIVVETTRHGFGITARSGRVVAERLTMPAISTKGDTVRIADHSGPGMNLSLFGRVPFRDYTITVPEDVHVHILEHTGVLDLR
jgi:hypothetical protein